MFSDPVHNIAQFDLQSGMKVADFGAGSGEVSIAAARAVGTAGKIYAIDVQKPMLERLQTKAQHEKIGNIEVIWGDVERPNGAHLKDGSMDAVIISNVLFQADDRKGMIEETKRVLKTGGKVLVVDWSGSFGGIGPQPEHVISEHEAKRILEEAGLRLVKSIEAGTHHYGFIYKK